MVYFARSSALSGTDARRPPGQIKTIPGGLKPPVGRKGKGEGKGEDGAIVEGERRTARNQ